MSTNNICFHAEIRKISILLDWKKHLLKSYGFNTAQIYRVNTESFPLHDQNFRSVEYLEFFFFLLVFVSFPLKNAYEQHLLQVQVNVHKLYPWKTGSSSILFCLEKKNIYFSNNGVFRQKNIYNLAKVCKANTFCTQMLDLMQVKYNFDIILFVYRFSFFFFFFFFFFPGPTVWIAVPPKSCIIN